MANTRRRVSDHRTRSICVNSLCSGSERCRIELASLSERSAGRSHSTRLPCRGTSEFSQNKDRTGILLQRYLSKARTVCFHFRPTRGAKPSGRRGKKLNFCKNFKVSFVVVLAWRTSEIIRAGDGNSNKKRQSTT